MIENQSYNYEDRKFKKSGLSNNSIILSNWSSSSFSEI